MRPIDADALLQYLIDDPLYKLVERYNIEGVIDNAPTIKAIPIPFIWDFMDHIEEEIAQTDDSDPRMPGLCARHNALRALLQAWKEQEEKE